MQCYVEFVLERGSKDPESFVLFNFDEVRSLLVQVSCWILRLSGQYLKPDLSCNQVLKCRDISEIYCRYFGCLLIPTQY